MTKKLNSFLIIILLITFAGQQAGLASGENFYSLRALSLSESKRARNLGTKAELVVARPAGSLWAGFLSDSDADFNAAMERLRKDVNEIYFSVLYRPEFKIQERFRRSYEAGSIAAGMPAWKAATADARTRYKYNQHFGIWRDIRKVVVSLQNAVGVSNDIQFALFLQQVAKVGAFAIEDVKDTQTVLGNFLLGLDVPAEHVASLNWGEVRDICRRLKPWLNMYLSLRAYEDRFKSRFQGPEAEGLILDTEVGKAAVEACDLIAQPYGAIIVAAAAAGKLSRFLYDNLVGPTADYSAFLGEAFWALVSDCKLTREYFESDGLYNEFISLLFKEKYRTGEINELYFGDTAEEIEETRRRLAREAQRQLNGRYGISEGNVLPAQILQLYGIPHPIVHWAADRDNYFTHITDPLFHTLRAARRVPSTRFKNRACLRMAVLMHDISKVEAKIDPAKLRRHPDMSEEMVLRTLADWGLTQAISEQEVALIKLLVRTHADLLSVRPGVPTTTPAEFVRRLTIPTNLRGYVDEMAVLAMIRRVTYADLSSIWGVARQGVEAGTLTSEVAEANIRVRLVERQLMPANALVLQAMISRDVEKGAAWSEPHRNWLFRKSISSRMKLFLLTATQLADIHSSRADRWLRLLADIRIKLPELAIPGEEADLLAFWNAAFNHCIQYKEDLLPSGRAVVRQITPFEESLRQALADYEIDESDMRLVAELNHSLRITVAEALKKAAVELPGRRGAGAARKIIDSVHPVGSSQKGTFVVRTSRVGMEKYADFDFDFDIYANLREPDLVRIAHHIRSSIAKVRALAIFLRKYRGLESFGTPEYQIVRLRQDPKAIVFRFSCVGVDLVDITISRDPTKLRGRQYNKAFTKQLAGLSQGQREEYLLNVRLMRDFIRNEEYLGISPQMRGCLWRAVVIEQLIMQAGRCEGGNWLRVVKPGSFEKAMEFIYAQSFDANGVLLSDEDFHTKVKRGLWVSNPVDQNENLMRELTLEEWKKLALASVQFVSFKETKSHWGLAYMAGKRLPLATRFSPYMRPTPPAAEESI